MQIKKLIKKIALPIACKFFLAPKSFLEYPEQYHLITCSKKDIELITNTSNNIMRIKTENRHLYFRECKKHKRLDEYVLDEINFYFEWITPDLNEDKKFIIDSLKNKVNFKKFVSMGMINDVTSGAYQFCMGNGADKVGFGSMDSEREKRMKKFVQFIWGSLFAYTLNKGVRNGYYQTYNSTRAIASYRIANAINLKDIIAKTEYAVLKVDEKYELIGTIMEEAPGFCMERMSKEDREKVVSPQLQRALNNLNVLDVICLEKDHRVGNYNVVFEGNAAISIVAFDNDSPGSFGIGGATFKTYMGCSPWLVNKKVNRMYLDKTTVKAILEIDTKAVCTDLKALLNGFQLIALRYRIHSMKKALYAFSENQILSEGQWSDESIKQELCDEHGDTYLKKFMQEQEIMPQPWLEE